LERAHKVDNRTDLQSFVFHGNHYHQISGCAMGSPVSAVIAELVMQRWKKLLKTELATLNKRNELDLQN
jgi:hypothetical protein